MPFHIYIGEEYLNGQVDRKTRIESRGHLTNILVAGHNGEEPHVRMMSDYDRPIMATAEDAVSAKHAAVQAGYYDDPFIGAFQQSDRRGRHVQPLIKRGTHARVSVMDRAIAAFIELNQCISNNGALQIVVLGAGKDTSFFRYQAGHHLASPGLTAQQPQQRVRWYEVDHEAVLSEKVSTVTTSPETFQAEIEKTASGWKLRSSQSTCNDSTCYMVAHDLRQNSKTLFDKLQQNDFDHQAPTLFIVECVQMYLPEESSRSLLQALAEACTNSCLCSYEPALQSDPFGKIMQENLSKVAQRDSCLVRVRTLRQHLERLKACGFVQATGCDMWSAYNSVVTAEQRRRANQSEFLDEVEEWMLIMRHYCVIVASTRECSIRTKYCQVGKDSALGFLPGQYEAIGDPAE